jgi:hypothetical protein
MVEPGAGSEEIREEIFETFRSKIEECDIEEGVADTILTNALADYPPREFSKQVVEDES